MTKTILEYETMLGEDNYFKSESDKKETEQLLNTLKTQLTQHKQKRNN